MFFDNKSTNRDEYQYISGNIGAMPKEFSKEFYNSAHCHERAQLVYGISGIMEIKIQNNIWILSPKTALLIPAFVMHSMRAITDISLRTLYIKQSIANNINNGNVKFLKVGSLLKELIARSILIPNEYDEKSIDGKIMDVIIHELKVAEEIIYSIPSPRTEKLMNIENMIMKDHILLKEKIYYWSEFYCISSKTLNRLIIKDLGVTFNVWRQYLSVKISLIQMSEQKSLTSIAYDLGYQSPSNFCRMFKNITGQNPSLFSHALK